MEFSNNKVNESNTEKEKKHSKLSSISAPRNATVSDDIIIILMSKLLLMCT